MPWSICQQKPKKNTQQEKQIIVFEDLEKKQIIVFEDLENDEHHLILS